jgi:hypothetical protein
MVIQQDFNPTHGPCGGRRAATERSEGALRARALADDGTDWRARLWRQLALSTGVYSVAHTLFGLRWASARTSVITADLEVGGLLFLLGLILLARLTRTLHEPAAAQDPSARELAGCSLLITMLLSFSPCLWFLLFRMQ